MQKTAKPGAPAAAGTETPFLSDVQALRQRARQQMEEGAVTSNYALDTKLVCKVLNEALATEIVCVLRYKRHYFMAKTASTFQVHGMGPFVVNYVNPADDPSKK